MCNKLSGGSTIVTIQTGKKRIYRVNYDNNNNNNFLFLQRKTNEHYQHNKGHWKKIYDRYILHRITS